MDAVSGPLLIVLAIGATTMLVLFASVPALLTVGMLAWSLGSTWFSPLQRGEGAVIGGILLMAASAKSRLVSLRESRVVWFPVAAGSLALLLAPILPQGAAGLRDPAQILTMGVVIIVVARQVPSSTAIPAYFKALTILAISSLAMWVVGIHDPESGTRFSGIAGNPNLLGIVAFLWVALSFEVGRRATLASAPLAASLVLLSGSRGSAFALAAALIAGLWVQAGSSESARSWRHVYRSALVASAAALGLGVAAQIRNQPDGPTIELLRSTDSGRLLAVTERWQLFTERPWTGYGFAEQLFAGKATSPVLIGDVPGVLALQLGIFGLVLFTVFVVGMLTTRWRTSPALAALIFSTLTSWAAEAWILGAGAMTTAVFWLSLAALTARPIRAPSRTPDIAASGHQSRSAPGRTPRVSSVRSSMVPKTARSRPR